LTRLIVFRFYKAPLVSRSRLKLLRRLNPDVGIVGIFGGPGRLGRAAYRAAGNALLGLDGLHISRADASWNWKHTDLNLLDWYRAVGQTLDFDVQHPIEWDLLVLEPLDSLYASIPPGALGLTALTHMSNVEQEWTWLRRPEPRREWDALLARARAEWRYRGSPMACLLNGACFPKSFLASYAELDPPELCHDELRVPLFAQILGFEMLDTRLRSPWHGERDHPFFHFRANEIELSAIRRELAKPNGWRAFHPVRRRLDPDMIFG
jgi:hypothetical protein